MDDVYLEGATPEGPTVVGHLSVIVDTAGITFLGPEPGERRTIGWDRTSPLEFGPPASLPGGETVTSLEFAVDGRPLRLLVPSKKDHEGVAQNGTTLEEATVAPVSEPVSVWVSEPVSEPVSADPSASPPEPTTLDEEPAAVSMHVAEPPAPVLHEPAAPVGLEEPPASLVPEPTSLDEEPAAVSIHVAEPPAPVLDEPAAPVGLEEPPASLVPEPTTPDEEPAAVSMHLAEPPAPVLDEPAASEPAEPTASLVPEPTTLDEEPAASVYLTDPPAPVVAERPAPKLRDLPAPKLFEPPAPVLAEPPAPVFREPPNRLVLDTPKSVGAFNDTFAVSESVHKTEAEDDDDLATARRSASFRYALVRSSVSRRREVTRAQTIVRLVVFTLLAGLIPIAAGVRYFHSQGTGHIVGVPLSDAAIAGHVGIQPGDLPGWSASLATAGNAFSAGATTHGAAALSTAEQASTEMARCLHVPVSAVDGAFGMGDAVLQRTAEFTSPSYADPAGNGGAVSSVVDVVDSTNVQEADSTIFQDPALFATCYQPFVQAMLPYAEGAGPLAFATATVQPIVVPVPSGPGAVTVAGFQIARIANGNGQTKTVVSTATAVFVGRVQATLGTVSNLVFSIDAQDQLVRGIESRAIGVGQL